MACLQSRPFSIVGRYTYHKRFKAAGGKIHVWKQAVLGMGVCCLCTDPAGGMMGQWKAAMGK